jgi:polysaccharide biosynthesis/export protein
MGGRVSARDGYKSSTARRVAVATLLLMSTSAAPALTQEVTDQPSNTAAGLGTVQPGDLIRVKVWREPDLSGDVSVDAAGNATLPRMGATSVRGLTADSVRRLIVTTYARYLRDPAVDVMVLPRVTITGAVRTPGVQNLDPTMTISDALALAGGAAPDGKRDQVELRRGGERVKVDLRMNTRVADSQVRSGDELLVPERSWLSRNVGLVLGVASLALSMAYFVRR